MIQWTRDEWNNEIAPGPWNLGYPATVHRTRAGPFAWGPRMKSYRIRDWARHFENNRTREMQIMRWVPVPNKHDGEGFQTIMAEPDGIMIYGCWHLILQVASKCLRERGTLLRDDGTPLTPHALAMKTGWRKADDFARALDFLSSAQVGWIECIAQEGAAIPQSGAAIPQEPAGNRMELNGRESLRERAREGFLGLVDRIRSARQEYGALDESAVLNTLRPAFDKPADLSAAVDAWVADHSNALKPYNNPIASLRKMVERVCDPSSSKPPAGQRKERYRGRV